MMKCYIQSKQCCNHEVETGGHALIAILVDEMVLTD